MTSLAGERFGEWFGPMASQSVPRFGEWSGPMTSETPILGKLEEYVE